MSASISFHMPPRPTGRRFNWELAVTWLAILAGCGLFWAAVVMAVLSIGR